MARIPNRLAFLLALMTAVSASGCGLFEGIRSYTNIDGGRFTIAEEKSYSNYSNGHISKVQGLLVGSTNYVRETNLAQLIADESGAPLDGNPLDCSKLDPGQCLSLAEKNFTVKYVVEDPTHSPSIKPNTADGLFVRNIVQERLIMASNSACREFTQHLNTFQSSSNFLLGAAATGAGAAGAIVTAASAARALAGAAGALSGTKAELNADIFENKFVPIITRSIDDRRRTFLSALRGYEVPSGMHPLPESEPKPGSSLSRTPSPAAASSPIPGAAASPAKADAPAQKDDVHNPTGAENFNWQYCGTSSGALTGQNDMNAEYQLPPNGYQCLPLSRYSLEAAIADAIYYNDLCSLDKGLENLAVALDIAKHPGLDDLVAAQDLQNQLLQKQLDGANLQQKILEAQKVTPTSNVSSAKAVTVTPALSFGTVKIGRSKMLKAKLVNSTGNPVTVSAATIPAGTPFSVVSGPPGCMAAAKPIEHDCAVRVLFTPTSKTASTAIMVVNETTGSHNVTH